MKSKSILITGCSSGIGYACARLLRDRGWTVFAACRSQSDCDRLKAEGFYAPRIDYEDETTVRAGLDEVLKTTGGTLDAVFQNGAYAVPGAVEDVPTEGLRRIFEANFLGWHALNRAVIPVMRAQGRGRIVHCSSVLGFVAMPWRGAYVATKFALEGLIDTLRLEMQNTPIKIILIEPGPITSDFRKNSVLQFEKWIDWQNSPRADQYRDSLRNRLYASSGKDTFELPSEAVAKKLIHALESPKPRPRYFVTTPTYIMAFMRRVLPTRALDAILGKAR